MSTVMRDRIFPVGSDVCMRERMSVSESVSTYSSKGYVCLPEMLIIQCVCVIEREKEREGMLCLQD